MRKRVAGAALLCVLTACNGSPDLPEPDPTLVQIYSDLALLAGDAGSPAPDSLRSEILEQYGYTQESFEIALQPYRDDPRGWIRFFEAVSDTIENRTGVRPDPSSP